MGIKFDCPNGHPLHVKSFLAGKRAKCPRCGAKVRVPTEESAGDVVGTPALVIASGNGRREPMGVENRTPGSPLQWYVRLPAGEQFGPAAEDKLQSWVDEGRIPVESWVWREGWTDWERAADHFAQLTHQEISPEPRPLEIEIMPQATSVLPRSERRALPAGRAPDRTLTAIIALSLASLVLFVILLVVLGRSG